MGKSLRDRTVNMRQTAYKLDSCRDRKVNKRQTMNETHSEYHKLSE